MWKDLNRLRQMPKLRSTNHDAVRFGAILPGSLEKGGNMPSVDTLLEMADVYSAARRASSTSWAAAVIANTPPVE